MPWDEKNALACAERDKELIDLICPLCGTHFSITYGRYRKTKNNIHLCRSCYNKSVGERNHNMDYETKQKRAKAIADGWARRTDEERQEWSQRVKDRYKNLSKIEKEKLAQISKERWENLPEEDKIKHGKISSKNMKEYWNNLSEEEKERRKKESSKILKKWRENITPEEKERISLLISKSTKNYWANISDDKLEEIRKRTSEKTKKWWKNLSPDERSSFINNASKKSKKWWENITPEQYEYWDKRRKEGVEKYIENLPNFHSKNENDVMDIFTSNNILFEDHWYNQTENPEMKVECPINPLTGYDFVSPYHQWDFKINFKNKNFKSILVDVDGSIHDKSKIKNAKITWYNGKKIVLSDLIAFYDKKRLYATDNLEAFAILVYDDNISGKTKVINLKTNYIMHFDQFLDLIKLFNLPERELDEKLFDLSKYL